MRRLLSQRLLTMPSDRRPIIVGGSAPVTVVAEDRKDIQVVLEGVNLRRIAERAILEPANDKHVFIRCERLWKRGGYLTAVILRVPRGSDYMRVDTWGRITVTGPLRVAHLHAAKSIEVEEIPSYSSFQMRTTRRHGRPTKVGRVSGDLTAWTKGGSVQIVADHPESLFISTIGGDIDLRGCWDDEDLEIFGDRGRVTRRRVTCPRHG
ncbi:hypothetical protein GCM10010402_17560 [Actinomadura luteofluorescens]|uniref:hypothetical protein n=1 Tax=Actinomadura luteofluorescens TaxID=46163 RepID=UPI002164E9EE|nr:hypothetical protein [Actinomadura glauciflava]MCR3739833.1 hypothetical protein [Actinomadura glauciflava]